MNFSMTAYRVKLMAAKKAFSLHQPTNSLSYKIAKNEG
jgi:hypothetical protein